MSQYNENEDYNEDDINALGDKEVVLERLLSMSDVEVVVEEGTRSST